MAQLLDPKNTLTVYQGQSKTFLLLADQPDPETAGAWKPLDLTGAELYLTVRATLDSTEITFQKTSHSSSQIEISSPRDGLARVFLTPGDTVNLSPKRTYVYDMWAVIGGKRHPIVEPSVFKVKQAVTRLPV